MYLHVSRMCFVLLLLLASAPAGADMTLSDKVKKAAAAYDALLATPDHEVPDALLARCECIGMFPGVLKGAFGFGARYGQGIVTCRNEAGRWSPPSFFKLTGGSVGFQIGAESADVVLFFMSERSARSLLESKFTLGGKVSVAAGPAGRSAEAATDLKLDAEIYSYAKSRGLFAGASLEGARLAVDAKANESYYGEKLGAEQLLFEQRAPRIGAEADDLIKRLPPRKERKEP